MSNLLVFLVWVWTSSKQFIVHYWFVNIGNVFWRKKNGLSSYFSFTPLNGVEIASIWCWTHLQSENYECRQWKEIYQKNRTSAGFPLVSLLSHSLPRLAKQWCNGVVCTWRWESYNNNTVIQSIIHLKVLLESFHVYVEHLVAWVQEFLWEHGRRTWKVKRKDLPKCCSSKLLVLLRTSSNLVSVQGLGSTWNLQYSM